jgi:DNA polymerase-3 subunit beta
VHVTVLQENLKRGLAIVGRAVAGKSTLPILSNVLLQAKDGALFLSATNLDIGITHKIGAQVWTDGSVTLPAKLFSDLVGGLPNGTVELSLTAATQTVQVVGGRSKSNVKGIDAEEFPTIPVAGVSVVTLPALVLRESIELVAIAAADDDSRPVLAGVLVRVRDGALQLAAANGYRLATRTVSLPEPITLNDMIIPAAALIELSRIIGASTNGDIEISTTPGGSQVVFTVGDSRLVSRLIDGVFPDFQRIIPAQYLTRTVVDTAELAKAVKLASYFAASSQNTVKLTLAPGGAAAGTLTISSNAAEVGDNTGAVDGMIDGEGGQIAMNVTYLAAALAAITTTQVALETQSAQSPGVFKPVGQEGYIHIVMPMSIR